MKISDVAKMLEMSRETIRYYEDQGLVVPKRGECNYREYCDLDLLVLKCIKLMKKYGFTLSEIKSVIDHFRHNSDICEITKKLNDKIDNYCVEIENIKSGIEFTTALLNVINSIDIDYIAEIEKLYKNSSL